MRAQQTKEQICSWSLEQFVGKNRCLKQILSAELKKDSQKQAHAVMSEMLLVVSHMLADVQQYNKNTLLCALLSPEVQRVINEDEFLNQQHDCMTYSKQYIILLLEYFCTGDNNFSDWVFSEMKAVDLAKHAKKQAIALVNHIYKKQVLAKKTTYAEVVQCLFYINNPCVSQHSSNDVCPICMTKAVDSKLDVCKHAFCKDCIYTWLKKTESCPMCRQSINSLSTRRTRL